MWHDSGWKVRYREEDTGKRNHLFFLFVFSKNFGWGALPPRPPVLGWGGKASPDPIPPNGRSSHLIEAAKRGRLDQMIFFSAPLTTRAPPTTVHRPSDNRPRYQRFYGTFFFCLTKSDLKKSDLKKSDLKIGICWNSLVSVGIHGNPLRNPLEPVGIRWNPTSSKILLFKILQILLFIFLALCFGICGYWCVARVWHGVLVCMCVCWQICIIACVFSME